jgi:hypothetical protein
LSRGNTHLQRSAMKARVKDEESYSGCQCDPKPPPARRCMRIVRRCQTYFFFQGPAGISVSINLPSREALTAGLNSRAQVPIGCPENGFGCILRLEVQARDGRTSYET